MTTPPRRAWLDALKGLGILLVVLGHFIEQYRPENKVVACLFFCIYLFHMALFCLCSGLVARFSLRRELTQTLWLYLLFQALFFVFRALLLQEDFAAVGGPLAALLLPWRHMWYLYALLFWQLTLPLLARLRDAFGLGGSAAGFAAAVGLGLAAGWVDWPFLLVRVFAFYPFYAFGVLFRPQLAALADRAAESRPLRTAAAALLVAGYGLCFVGGLLGRFDPLQTARIFQDAPYGEQFTAPDRALFYAVGLATCLALVCVCSRAKALAPLGRRTLPVYLLHMPLLAFLVERAALYEPLRGGSPLLQLAFACTLAAACVLLCSCRPIAAAFEKIANLWYHRTKV